MNRLTNLLSILVATAVLCGLTTPVLAGPTPPPQQTECTTENPVSTVVLDGSKKNDAPHPWGGGTFTNKFMTHEITGNIIKVKNWKVDICEGSIITHTVFDQLGVPVLTDNTPGLNCNQIGCSGVISNKERRFESFTYSSTGSGDVDTIEFKSPNQQPAGPATPTPVACMPNLGDDCSVIACCAPLVCDPNEPHVCETD
jgi:hypothetical protein